MTVCTGEETAIYALTSEHAKRLSQWLLHTVENYEKQHGKIDAEWSPGMKSPLQGLDLSGGANTDSAPS